jgi:hypothetical protein
MREWNGADIKVRFDEFAGTRHGNMRVSIDGDALWPYVTPRLAVFACRGVRVFVPDVSHFECLYWLRHAGPCRASTFSVLLIQEVDGRVKPGHDDVETP